MNEQTVGSNPVQEFARRLQAIARLGKLEVELMLRPGRRSSFSDVLAMPQVRALAHDSESEDEVAHALIMELTFIANGDEEREVALATFGLGERYAGLSVRERAEACGYGWDAFNVRRSQFLLRAAGRILYPDERKAHLVDHSNRPHPLRPQFWQIPTVLSEYIILREQCSNLSTLLPWIPPAALNPGELIAGETLEDTQATCLYLLAAILVTLNRIDIDQGGLWYVDTFEDYHLLRGKLQEVAFNQPFDAIGRARLRNQLRLVHGEPLLFAEAVAANLPEMHAAWDAWTRSCDGPCPALGCVHGVAKSASEATGVLLKATRWLESMLRRGA